MRPELNRRELLLGGGIGLAALAMPQALARTPAQHLPAVNALLDDLVRSGKLPGLVTSLASGPGAPRFVSRGRIAFDDRSPMTPDTLFRIYSMTKVVTGMAAVELIARGKLRLDQPVADVLPKFARMQVLVSPDAPVDQVHPAKAQITMRNLLTHTAGLGYTVVQTGPIRKAYLAAGLGGGQVSREPLPGEERSISAPGLAAFADRLAEMPLVYEPGTQWSYSLGLDLMGRVIEVVTGMPFDRYLRQTIFDPCGMVDTGFQVPARKASRLATNYGIKDGKLVPIDPGASSIYLDPPPMPWGGSGLVSSARDFDRFMAMVAGGGLSGRHRVLSVEAVALGTSNLLPPGAATRGTWMEGAGHGAGAQLGLGEKAGVLGWSGAAGTVFRIDCRRGIRAALYSQHMPTSAYALYDKFPKAAGSDLSAPQLAI
ncbi:MAG: serine hydrolase domain-containing protein [Sphingomonadaceae bacterium]